MTSEVMLVHCMCVCSTHSFSQLPVDFSHHKLTHSYSPLSTGQTQKEKEFRRRVIQDLGWISRSSFMMQIMLFRTFKLTFLHYLMMNQYLCLKPACRSLTIARVKI